MVIDLGKIVVGWKDEYFSSANRVPIYTCQKCSAIVGFVAPLFLQLRLQVAYLMAERRARRIMSNDQC